jgi:hypothetical protein
MLDAIGLAVEGEPEDRVHTGYSNIALMKAWLDVDAGTRFGEPALVERGEALAAAVVARFDRHGAFDEYNSPTYYGIDLWALALWRSFAPARSPLRAWGERLEQALWSDIARWYHAGLRNLAGPYTRAYGIDLQRYVSLIAVWVWTALGRDVAPLPDLDGGADHAHDLCFGPCATVTGVRMPEPARAAFGAFTGERRVEQVVSTRPVRRATAWLSADVMFGAEGGDSPWAGWWQFLPATVHWRAPAGRTGTIRLVHDGAVDALAEPGVLTAECRGRGAVAFLVGGTGLRVARRDIDAREWRLPGLTVGVTTEAALDSVVAGPDGVDIRYHGAPSTFRLAVGGPGGGPRH